MRYADPAADGAGPSAADRPRSDAVAVEEPLELRLNGSVLTVTMRTPGADIDLAHGWLLTEGIIGSVADV
ncbi:MAG: formate dehydrogenase accessory sulfurtransferase FdhD, partial [Nostocoides sp.]